MACEALRHPVSVLASREEEQHHGASWERVDRISCDTGGWDEENSVDIGLVSRNSL